MIETLDELRASAEMEIYREVEQDEKVIGRIAAAQREELEQEIATLQAVADRVAEEAWELAGKLPVSLNSWITALEPSLVDGGRWDGCHGRV
jgi:hypothetical protein